MKRNREKNNKDFITDGYTTDKIKEVIKEIREKYKIEELNSVLTETEIENIKKEYTFFNSRYPFLFDMILKKDLDYNRLNYMLNLREKIVNNKTTVEKASEKLGVELYNEYHKK